MWLKKAASSLSAVIARVTQVMNIMGVFVLTGMMLLSVADVGLRYLFRRPILGSTEITEYMMVFLALGMGWCIVTGKAIKMDLIMQRLPQKMQVVVDSITCFISLGVLTIVTWQVFGESINLWQSSMRSPVLDISPYPFYGVLALGCAILCMALVDQLVRNIAKAVKR